MEAIGGAGVETACSRRGDDSYPPIDVPTLPLILQDAHAWGRVLVYVLQDAALAPVHRDALPATPGEDDVVPRTDPARSLCEQEVGFIAIVRLEDASIAEQHLMLAALDPPRLPIEQVPVRNPLAIGPIEKVRAALHLGIRELRVDLDDVAWLVLVDCEDLRLEEHGWIEVDPQPLD